MSGCILHLAISHRPVFLLNSCLDLFSAPPSLEDPLSRSYGVSLPSSLTMNRSTPWYILPDYLCRSAVRAPKEMCLALFLGSMVTRTIRNASMQRGTIALRLGMRTCLHASAPSCFNAQFQMRAAVSLLRQRIALLRRSRNINREAIGLAARLILRTRLTPG